MRYQVKRKSGGRNGEGRTATGSIVMVVSWCLILSWLGFLFYCWQTGQLHSAKLPSTYVNKLTGMLDSVDHSLRGATHDLVGIPHAHANTEHQGALAATTHAAVAAKAALAAAAAAAAESDIHIIFSTDCTTYQDWQTLVLFHSAVAVGQKGPLTRIASGCDEEKKQTLTALYQKLYPQYHVHFTPDFKKDDKTGHSYDFYNKPWGLKHWLKNAVPTIPAGTAVALLDPDMILVRPLTMTMRGQPNNLYNKHLYKTEEDILEKVAAGKPVAQLYGLGAPWTNDNHKKFNRTYICGADSPCREPNMPFGEQHYAVGPPYIVVKEDMERLAETWTRFVPRVYEHYPYLLAEMYAYSMAAAHERLPHVQFEHLMVSNTDSPGEGWPWVDALQDACVPPTDGVYYPGTPLPTVVHYCQNFRAGELGFAKRQVHRDIFSCKHPLFKEPPPDLGRVDFRIKDGERQPLKGEQVNRNVYTLCVIHRSINAALIDYKKRMCDSYNATNYDKTYNVLSKG